MELPEEIKYKDIKMNLKVVVEQIEKATSVKFKKVLDDEYVAEGQITEKDLVDIGFVYVTSSITTMTEHYAVYRIAKNIEAIFEDTILHVCDTDFAGIMLND